MHLQKGLINIAAEFENNVVIGRLENAQFDGRQEDAEHTLVMM